MIYMGLFTIMGL